MKLFCAHTNTHILGFFFLLFISDSFWYAVPCIGKWKKAYFMNVDFLALDSVYIIVANAYIVNIYHFVEPIHSDFWGFACAPHRYTFFRFIVGIKTKENVSIYCEKISFHSIFLSFFPNAKTCQRSERRNIRSPPTII